MPRGLGTAETAFCVGGGAAAGGGAETPDKAAVRERVTRRDGSPSEGPESDVVRVLSTEGAEDIF
jgi:hypothetical protein